MLPSEFGGEALTTTVPDAELVEGMAGPVAEALDVPLAEVAGVQVLHPELFSMNAWRFPGADASAIREEYIATHVVPPGSEEPARTDEILGDMDVAHFAPSTELGTPNQYVLVVNDDVLIHISAESDETAESLIEAIR